jgi:hypothetical protein
MAKPAKKQESKQQKTTPPPKTANRAELPWQGDEKKAQVPAPPEERELTNLQGRNYFEQFGDAVSQRVFTGRLLKFSKGDYLAGQDAEEIPEGTRVVAVMDTLETGWVKWWDNKPEKTIMGLVVDGYSPPRRSELGDTDEALWEVDAQSGKYRDPWALASQVVMQPLDWDGNDQDALFTFVTQSRGGLNAVGNLAKAYGTKIRTDPDVYPVVELGVDAYDHQNRNFGRIKIPVFTIVNWVAKA